ncbi:MAG: DUF6261 family protein [Tannerella sp.]|jgi:hypothetical protein|nr:DUF6261 family protein [Tannerella sp.]
MTVSKFVALIKLIAFSLLRNEEHHSFMVAFRQLITTFKDVNELLTLFLAPFDELVLLEQELMDASRKSNLTEHIVEVDERLDRDLVGLKSAVFTALHHFDPTHVAAAKILENYLKPFGSIGSKSYKAESAAVQKLVFDMLNTYAPQVTILGLGEWIEEINLAEVEFTTTYAERNAEQADRPQAEIRDVRRDMEGYYFKMTNVAEADVNLNGPAKCGEFIRQLNNQIDDYNAGLYPTRHDIIHAVAVPIPTQKYTGKAIIPIPEVHYVQEGHPTVELVFSVDFTVTYKENVNVGDAELIIHGKGKYKGKKTITFNIERTV